MIFFFRAIAGFFADGHNLRKEQSRKFDANILKSISK